MRARSEKQSTEPEADWRFAGRPLALADAVCDGEHAVASTTFDTRVEVPVYDLAGRQVDREWEGRYWYEHVARCGDTILVHTGRDDAEDRHHLSRRKWEALYDHALGPAWREQAVYVDPGYADEGKAMEKLIAKHEKAAPAGWPILFIHDECRAAHEVDRRDGVKTRHGCAGVQDYRPGRPVLVCMCECHDDRGERPQRCGHQIAYGGCTRIATVQHFPAVEYAWDGWAKEPREWPFTGARFGGWHPTCEPCWLAARAQYTWDLEVGNRPYYGFHGMDRHEVTWPDWRERKEWTQEQRWAYDERPTIPGSTDPGKVTLRVGRRWPEDQLATALYLLREQAAAAGYDVSDVEPGYRPSPPWLTALAKQYKRHGRITDLAAALGADETPAPAPAVQEALF